MSASRVTIYTAAALVAAPVLTLRTLAYLAARGCQAALVAAGLARWEDFR